MKKCKKCGHPLEKKTSFCPECGHKVKKGIWKWMISLIVLLFFIGAGVAVFYTNTDDKPSTPSTHEKESSNSDETEQLKTRLLDHQEVMAAAVSWYGEEVLFGDKGFDSWDKEVTKVKPCTLNDDCANTEKGDGTYYAYQFDDGRNNSSGYVLSNDQQKIYLYSRLSIAKGVDEKPIKTVALDDLVDTIMTQSAKDEIYQRADDMVITDKGSDDQSDTSKKDEDESSDKAAESLEKTQTLIRNYMSEWQEAMGQDYEENTVTPDENVIEMEDVTITNDLGGSDDALLSINAKFVDLNTSKESKQGYQVLAAYSGVSDNAKKYRYLFVLHDGKPEVLVAHMPEAVGDTDKGPAVNFVPTQNAALPGAFKQIMEDRSAPDAPEKSENVVSSLDDAKALYEEAWGAPGEEGTEPYDDACGMDEEGNSIPGEMTSKWKQNSDGSYTYSYSVNNGGAIRGYTTIYSDGSMERFTIHSGQVMGGKCTYEDVQDGTAKDKLMSMDGEELEEAGIRG